MNHGRYAATHAPLVLALVLTAPSAHAATIDAASCDAVDVQAAVDMAALGDTVSIPAGTCSWTSGVSWNAPANVTLVGAGSLDVQGGGDATVIVDDYASGAPLFDVTTA